MTGSREPAPLPSGAVVAPWWPPSHYSSPALIAAATTACPTSRAAQRSGASSSSALHPMGGNGLKFVLVRGQQPTGHLSVASDVPVPTSAARQ